MQIDLKLNPPKGYEFTGEYRNVKSGEYYFYIDSLGNIFANTALGDSSFPYLILRKIDVWREATIDDLKRVKAGEKVECRVWDGVVWQENYTLIGWSRYPSNYESWSVRCKDGFYSGRRKCEVKE